jgi:hypothetical protein
MPRLPPALRTEIDRHPLIIIDALGGILAPTGLMVETFARVKGT